MNDDDTVLYYVMASAYLCVVRMADIEAAFDANIESCLHGGNLTTIAPELDIIQCNNNETLAGSYSQCGSLQNLTGGNRQVGGTIPVRGEALLKLSYGFMGNIANIGKQSVIIHGHPTYRKPYHTELIRRNLNVDADELIPNKHECPGRNEFYSLHNDKKHIFRFHSRSFFPSSTRNIGPSTTITKSVLGSCGRYDGNCTACLLSGPLCGWCSKDHLCTLESECYGTQWTQGGEISQDADWFEQTCSATESDLHEYDVNFLPVNGIIDELTTVKAAITTPLSLASLDSEDIYVDVFMDDYLLCENIHPVICNQSQSDKDLYPWYDSRQLKTGTQRPLKCSYFIECNVRHTEEKMEGKVSIKLHINQTPYIRITINSTESFNFGIPTIQAFWPTRGPKAGGTLLEIKGENLMIGENIDIIIAGLQCVMDMNDISKDRLVCRTPEVDTLPKTSKVTIIYNGNYVTSSSQVYTFTEDPVITSIYPLKTFQTGGTVQYVSGVNINSIEMPVFIVNMVTGNEIIASWTSICTVSNTSLMACLTPEFAIDSSELINQRDMKRSVGGKDECQYITSISDDVDTKTSDVTPVKFQVGFGLDGVQKWLPRYIVESLDVKYTTLSVAQNPVFYGFHGDNAVLTFDPNEDEYLVIEGERLDCGVQITDIVVEIGSELCEPIVSLDRNQLLCKPPEHQPSIIPGYDTNSSYPHVMVRIGKDNVETKNSSGYFIGYVEYQSINLSTSGKTSILLTYLPLICGVLGVVVIVMIIAIVIVFNRKTRKGPPTNDTEQHDSPTTTYELMACTDKRMESTYQSLVRYHTPGNNDDFQMFLSPQCYKGFLSPLRGKSQIFEWLDDDLSLRIQEVCIDRERLVFDTVETLGKGAFGKVILGELLRDMQDDTKRLKVAVKSLKRDTEINDIRRFLEEGILMKDFDHPNVLSLIGVCFDESCSPLIVLPYMKNGDLKSHVANPKRVLMVANLIMYALHVARGMEYLSSMKFVHRDLAARNCMVDTNEIVKVSDFGLSRDIYEKEYYASEDKKAKLPIRWMSPESIKRAIYNTKTDVWSFGVLFWEVLTRGELPYGSVDNWDIPKYLDSGRRLDKPSYVPDKLFDLISDCWDDDPRKRPDFGRMAFEMQDLLNRKGKERRGKSEYYNTAVDSPCYLNLLED